MWPALPCVRLDKRRYETQPGGSVRSRSVGRELPTHLGASGDSLHNSHMFISESIPLIALNVGIPPYSAGRPRLQSLFCKHALLAGCRVRAARRDSAGGGPSVTWKLVCSSLNTTGPSSGSGAAKPPKGFKGGRIRFSPLNCPS